MPHNRTGRGYLHMVDTYGLSKEENALLDVMRADPVPHHAYLRIIDALRLEIDNRQARNVKLRERRDEAVKDADALRGIIREAMTDAADEGVHIYRGTDDERTFYKRLRTAIPDDDCDGFLSEPRDYDDV